MLAQKPYDLLISDLGLDGMDGYSFVRAIRKTPQLKHLPAIALSGFGRQVDVNRAIRSGFNGHLPKPATISQIREAVARLRLSDKPV